MCDTEFDSSALVWYNQSQNAPKAEVPRDLYHDHLSNLAGKQGIETGAAIRPLDDLGDPPEPLDQPAADSALGSKGVDSVVDSMLTQQAASNNTAVNAHGKQDVDLARDAEGGKSVTSLMLDRIGNISGGSVASVNETQAVTIAASAGALPKSDAVSGTQTWKEHLSNPFCFSLLCLCFTLLICVFWLAKVRFRRRKVVRC